MKILETEPVAVVGAVVTAATAVVGALVTQGVVHFSADQLAAWTAAATAVLGLPVTFLVRSRVTPVIGRVDAPVEAPPA